MTNDQGEQMSGRTKVMSTLTVVALIGVYGLVQTVKDEVDKRKVIVTGLWLESPRDDRVEVALSVGAATNVTAHLVAPVMRVYKVAPGTRVQIRLRLLGSSGAKFLGCKATVDGVMPHEGVGDMPMPNAKPGAEVTCWAIA